VLDAQRGLHEAQLELTRSEEALALNVVSLFKALG
jgi:outer membrane protein TolC